MANYRALFIGLFLTLVLTGFVSADAPYTFDKIIINDMEYTGGDIILNAEQEVKVEVWFTSYVNDSEIVLDVVILGDFSQARFRTEPFDVVEGESYKKTLFLEAPYGLIEEASGIIIINIESAPFEVVREIVDIILITPEDSLSFCQYGNGVGENPGDLRTRISDITVREGFGDDEEWFPFDEIEVEFEVENHGDEDIDNIKLLWGLYDTEQEEWIIDVGGLDEFNLGDGDEESFTVNFRIDNHMDVDLDDLTSGQHYILYTRATGDVDNGNNDYTCNWDSEKIEIIIESDLVILDNIDAWGYRENIVEVGDWIEVEANVWNIGSENQDDVYVRIYNNELNIDEIAYVNDNPNNMIPFLERGEIELEIEIPEDAIEGTYNLNLEVYNEDNEIYQNSYGVQSVYTKTIEVIGVIIPPEIEIIFPQEDSIIKGDFAPIMVETNENCVCEYSLYKIVQYDYLEVFLQREMETTGGMMHLGEATDLEQGGEYAIIVGCVNEEQHFMHTGFVHFSVDFSNVSDVMILEDIGEYLYEKSTMIEIPGDDEEISAMYFAYYDKNDDNIYAASVMEFDSIISTQNFLDGTIEAFNLVPYNINENIVYVSTDPSLQLTYWVNGRFILSIAVFSLEESQPMPLPLVEAYLEKYPSDLSVTPDTTSPIIDLLDPDDNEDYEVDEDEEEDIDFRYEVYDDSKIDYCELIVDGDVEKTDRSIEREVTQKFEEEFDEGDYDWKIRCVDVHGNIGESEERDFDIDEEKDKKKDSSYDYDYLVDVDDKEEKKTDFIGDFQPTTPITLNGEEKESKTFDINLDLNTILPIVLGVAILTILIILGIVVMKR